MTRYPDVAGALEGLLRHRREPQTLEESTRPHLIVAKGTTQGDSRHSPESVPRKRLHSLLRRKAGARPITDLFCAYYYSRENRNVD